MLIFAFGKPGDSRRVDGLLSTSQLSSKRIYTFRSEWLFYFNCQSNCLKLLWNELMSVGSSPQFFQSDIIDPNFNMAGMLKMIKQNNYTFAFLPTRIQDFNFRESARSFIRSLLYHVYCIIHCLLISGVSATSTVGPKLNWCCSL